MTFTYTLTDAVKVAAEHPDTFGVPSSSELADLKAGDMVKLIFEPPKALTRPRLGNKRMMAERMWVRVSTVTPDGCTGTLCNHPISLPLEPGDRVEFKLHNIIDLIDKKEGDK